jgi:hypothetical protein
MSENNSCAVKSSRENQQWRKRWKTKCAYIFPATSVTDCLLSEFDSIGSAQYNIGPKIKFYDTLAMHIYLYFGCCVDNSTIVVRRNAG